MKRLLPVLVILILAAAQSACSSSQLLSYFPVMDRDRTVLGYYRWVSSADAEDLQAQLEKLLPVPAEGYSLTAAVQLALIYSASGLQSPPRREEALNLLAQLQEEDVVTERDREYYSFARIWQKYLEQERSISMLEGSLAERNQELRTASEINQNLQEQIDALTNIEQQLIERERIQVNDEQ